MTMHNVEHLITCRHQLIRHLITSITGSRYYLCEICRGIISTESGKLHSAITVPFFVPSSGGDSKRRTISRVRLDPGEFSLRPLASMAKMEKRE